VQGNFVFLSKATAPFGAPSMLSVHPAYATPPFAPAPIQAYDKSSLAWSPNGDDLAVVNADSGDSADTGMHVVHGLAGATATAASATSYADEIVNGTGGDCCGYESWSDLNYLPSGALGYGVADLGFELEYAANPRYTLKYSGFASQLGDKAGSPSPSGNSMVFVRTSGSTPNIWTSTAAGTARKQIQANGYQPDWQPLP